MAARRYVRTAKGLLLIVLPLLAALAAFGAGTSAVVPVLAAAIGAAVLVDIPILWFRKHRWVFPDGALLTGLYVAMILSPHEPWYVAAVTAALAILSKYALRSGTANIFNPAALALVATFYLFDTAQSWWGALPELPPLATLALLASGAYITFKVNKFPVVLAFLGGYYLLITASAFLGRPEHVVELYRAPDLQAALFFAFFMVTDPPTSPPRHRDQLVYGLIVAVVSYAVFELIGAAYFLLVGLLVANVWEAWRRARLRAASSRLHLITRPRAAT